MNPILLAWLGAGLLGAYLLGRDPGKLIFDRDFKGAGLRTVVLVLAYLSAMSGPMLLIVVLLLPSKKQCPSCFSAVRRTESTCPKCSAYVPDEPRPSMTAQERVVESQISHLSPAVQAAVARGQKDISLISGLLMIGTIILSLFLGAFVFKNATGELIVSGILLGVVLGWLWWSFSIPRWREWALKQPGVDPDQLQKAAEIAGLVWPKGHFFEKTEFRFKK